MVLPSASSSSSSSAVGVSGGVAGCDPTLAHFFPLQGSYADVVNVSALASVQGNVGCASFTPVAAASSAFTQTCGAGSDPATLYSASPVESSDVSQCAMVYLSSLLDATSGSSATFFSCDGFASGAVDCLHVRYTRFMAGGSAITLLIAQLNENGDGNGAVVTLPTAAWFQLCATYSASASTLTTFIDGALANNLTVAHSAAQYGSPVLGGDGQDDEQQPTQGSFLNWRIYTAQLSQAEMQDLQAEDAAGAPVAVCSSNNVANVVAQSPGSGSASSTAASLYVTSPSTVAASSTVVLLSRATSASSSVAPLPSAGSSSSPSAPASSSSAAVALPGASSSLSMSSSTVVLPSASSSSSSSAVGVSGGVAGCDPTLAHFFPLQGSYADVVNVSALASVQGNVGCASFTPVAAASSAFTQTCGAGSDPATLYSASPVESSDVSQCAMVYLSSLLDATSGSSATFFSCDGFASGAVDCLHVRYTRFMAGGSAITLLIAQLNENGDGNGAVVTLPTAAWFQLCATYSASASTLTTFIDGALANNLTVAHSAAQYGSPVLGGDGQDDEQQPTQGSFLNWRIYTAQLSQAEMQDLQAAERAGTAHPGVPPHDHILDAVCSITPASALPRSSVRRNEVTEMIFCFA